MLSQRFSDGTVSRATAPLWTGCLCPPPDLLCWGGAQGVSGPQGGQEGGARDGISALSVMDGFRAVSLCVSEGLCPPMSLSLLLYVCLSIAATGTRGEGGCPQVRGRGPSSA